MTRSEKIKETKARRKLQDERLNFLKQEAIKVVQTGLCPRCQNPLHRNLALAGWYQCSAYPDVYMRKPGFEKLPKCDFQCFTE